MKQKSIISSLFLSLSPLYAQNYNQLPADYDFQGNSLFSGVLDVTAESEFSNNMKLFLKSGQSFIALKEVSTNPETFNEFFKLDVSGTSGFMELNGSPVLTAQNAVDFGYVDSNNLGAQTYTFSAPTESTSSTTGALTVAGGVGIAKDSYVNGLTIGRGGGNNDRNTALGLGALDNNASTGVANTAIGRGALENNTTSDHNTAIGQDSLSANTIGYQNTAIGSQSMLKNTTGKYNVSVGVNSLYYNTVGYENTALGRSSLVRNTSGNQNVAAGCNSLFNNTTGNGNTANGRGSLNNNTVGGYNVGSGFFTMAANTSGTHNSAFGSTALRWNLVGKENSALGNSALFLTKSNYNVGVGSSSLYSNQNGERNTAVGFQALYSVNGSEAHENVALGSEAGRFQANRTPLNNSTKSIYIGAKARGKDNADDNSIVIGYDAEGKGANTTVIGNEETTETYLHGKVILDGPSGDISMGIFGGS